MIKKKVLNRRRFVESFPCLQELRERLENLKQVVAGLEEKKGKKGKKWIQNVVKGAEKKGTKGAFHDWCVKQGFTKVNKSCIQKAKQVAREKGDTKLMKRAVAAENMLKASGVIE